MSVAIDSADLMPEFMKTWYIAKWSDWEMLLYNRGKKLAGCKRKEQHVETPLEQLEEVEYIDGIQV